MSSPSADHAVNSDEVEAPKWLDESFFIKVLQQCDKAENIKIKSLELKPAVAKNDHYVSVMFRVTCTYLRDNQTKTRSMILKTVPEQASLKKDLLECSPIFATEIGIYADIIPKFETILKAAGDNTQLGPNLSPRQVIIFEDLVQLGFTTLGRPANMEEVRTAFIKLARFHAVGFKLLSEQPKIFDKFRYSMFTMPFVESNIFRKGIPMFIQMLEENDDLRHYKRYFEKYSNGDLMKQTIASYEEYWNDPQTGTYYVLCHGDFHNKNFMLKHNTSTGKFEDLMLLDYQMSFVGPLTTDIFYAIYLMLDNSLRTNRSDELLHSYFEHFQQTLQHIHYRGEMPKYEEFHKQLMRHKHVALFFLTTCMAMWYGIRDGEFEPDEVETSEELHRQLYKNKNYLNDVRALLPKLKEQGYLE